MHFHGSPRTSSREVPFTPPRDDPATRPRFAFSPRHLDTLGSGEDPTRAATRQACTLTAVALCVFSGIVVAGFGLFAFASAVLGDQVKIACKEQPIDNGVIEAGVANATTTIQCNDRYSLELPPQLALECRLIWQRCVEMRRATTIDEAVRRCEREYAYVHPTHHRATSAEDPHLTDDVLDSLRTQAYRATRGVCVLSEMVHTERLYGQRAPLLPIRRLAFGPQASSCFLAAALAAAAAVLTGGCRGQPTDAREQGRYRACGAPGDWEASEPCLVREEGLQRS